MDLITAREISEILEKDNPEREISICDITSNSLYPKYNEMCLVSSFNGHPNHVMITKRDVRNLFNIKL